MKYKCVIQYGQEDCGAACLASIIKYHNLTFTLNRIREAVGTGQLGTTLLGLKQGSEALGFNARAVSCSPKIINKIHKIPLPSIIYWKGYHFVVLYGQKGKNYIVANPAVGIRYLSKKELIEGWTGWVMLLLEPDPIRFSEQPDDAALQNVYCLIEPLSLRLCSVPYLSDCFL